MKNRLAILNYHQIPEEQDVLHPYTCDRRIFRKQLQTLDRYFNVVSLDQGVAAMREGRLGRNSVAITFDDGYRNNFEVAFEELKAIGLSATFFVATDYLDGGTMWNDIVVESVRRTTKTSMDLKDFGLDSITLGSDIERIRAIDLLLSKLKYLEYSERQKAVLRFSRQADVTLPTDLMMTSEQVIALHEGGMLIGGHTASHPILLRLSEEDAREDIQKGREFLKELLGVEPRLFAYPNGKTGQDYNGTHVKMLAGMDFDAAFTTQWGYADASTNRYELPRVGFGIHTGWQFGLRLLRSYFESQTGVTA